MNPPRIRLKIRQEVYLVSLLLSLFSTVLIIVLFSFVLYLTEITETKLYTESANEQVSITAYRYFINMAEMVDIIANIDEVIHGSQLDSQGQQRILDHFSEYVELNDDILYLYAGYEDGTMLINDWVRPEGYNPTIRPWYTEAVKASPHSSLAEPYLDIGGELWLLSQSKTLIDEHGKITGVISIDSPANTLYDILAYGKLYDSQRSYIISSTGKVHLHFNDDYLGKYYPSISDLLTEDSGEINYDLNNKQVIGYYKLIENTDWYVVTVIDRYDVITPIIRKTIIFSIVGLLFSLLLGSIHAWVYDSRYIMPLKNLAYRIKKITEGNTLLEADDTLGNYEFKEIASNIELLAEISLKRKTEELSTIIESSLEGIIVVNNIGDVLYVNSMFKKIFNINQYTNITSIKDVTLVSSMLNSVNQTHNSHLFSQTDGVTEVFQSNNGKYYEQFVSPLVSEGIVTGRIWNFRDITERYNKVEKLNKLAMQDGLTMLLNKRTFMERGELSIKTAIKYNHQLSVLMLDIDHFKTINDTYGHNIGDVILQNFADEMTSMFRKSDLIGRVGGEEFAILLENTALDTAVELSEKFRALIESTTHEINGITISFTVSIGVAELTDEIDLKTLINTADQHLYKAKESGRNRVISG